MTGVLGSKVNDCVLIRRREHTERSRRKRPVKIEAETGARQLHTREQ